MNTEDKENRDRLPRDVHTFPIRHGESGNVRERIRWIIGDEPVAAFARRAKISESTLRDYISEDDTKRKKPGMENLRRIADAGGVSIDFLVTGKSAGSEPMRAAQDAPLYMPGSKFVFLPLHRNVSASAGNGAVVWDEHDVDHLAFQESFIRQDLRAKPADLRLVRVAGDSMERLLYSGDMVMVDTSVHQLQAEGMYVFRLDDSVSVKWMSLMPGGVIRVSSENSAKYPAYEITRAQAESDHFQVLGLVRWWAHTQR
jgi:phage repressor protein C with HTH and peptisase S24 domain